MFGRKRKYIEELEELVRKQDNKIKKLENQLTDAKECIRKMTDSFETIPNHCVPGKYCRSCEHVKEYYTYSYGVYPETHYACGRGGTCSDFIQKGAGQ